MGCCWVVAVACWLWLACGWAVAGWGWAVAGLLLACGCAVAGCGWAVAWLWLQRAGCGWPWLAGGSAVAGWGWAVAGLWLGSSWSAAVRLLAVAGKSLAGAGLAWAVAGLFLGCGCAVACCGSLWLGWAVAGLGLGSCWAVAARLLAVAGLWLGRGWPGLASSWAVAGLLLGCGRAVAGRGWALAGLCLGSPWAEAVVGLLWMTQPGGPNGTRQNPRSKNNLRPSAAEFYLLHAPQNVQTKNILTKRNTLVVITVRKRFVGAIQQFLMGGKWKSESCNSESRHLRTGATTKRYSKILVCRLGMPTRYADWVCRLGMPTVGRYSSPSLAQYNGARPYIYAGQLLMLYMELIRDKHVK